MRFILYFILFVILYRLFKSLLKYLSGNSNSKTRVEDVKKDQAKVKKYENIEEAKFKEIKDDKND